MNRRAFRPLLVLLMLFVLAAPLSAVAAPTPPSGSSYYVVQRGDTLAKIAARLGVSAGEIIRSNGISNPNLIYTGQRLVVPGSATAASGASSAPAPAPSSANVPADTSGSTYIPALTSDSAAASVPSAPDAAAVAPPSESAAASSEVAAASVVYIVKRGDTLSRIAARYGTTIKAIMTANRLKNANYIYVGQRLTIPGKGAAPKPNPNPAPSPVTGRWIDVNLSQQRLTAYEGSTAVFTTLISSGTAAHPTVVGRYKVYAKYAAQSMSGPGYYLPNVPYVMYFYKGYAIHGTYWHNNFGHPMSHGCVNVSTPGAAWLYGWAGMGTTVVTHY